MKTESASSRILRIAIFTLVPLAWFSFPFWEPVGDSWRPDYSVLLEWMNVGFMATVFLTSLLSWRRHQYRLLSAFGFIICYLWVAVILLPTL